MSMKLRQIAAAAALVATTVGASAQTVVPWGSHGPAELGGTLFYGTGSSFPFDFIYTFSLAGLSDLLGVGVTNDSVGVFDINGAAARLYASNGNANYNDDVLIGGFAFDSTSITQNFTGLAAGDYFYRVTGNVDGPFGGSYLLSSHLTPVPEPKSYALLMAGLGVVALLARRRRS
jgi:hypothetical protein